MVQKASIASQVSNKKDCFSIHGGSNGAKSCFIRWLLWYVWVSVSTVDRMVQKVNHLQYCPKLRPFQYPRWIEWCKKPCHRLSLAFLFLCFSIHGGSNGAKRRFVELMTTKRVYVSVSTVDRMVQKVKTYATPAVM